MNYSIHYVRPGYWLVRNLYNEILAECHNAAQASALIGMLTR